MEAVKVEGTRNKDIFLYTLSTCGWCRKTKSFLRESGVGFSYVDVDLVPPEEKEAVLNEVRKWNPACSFPTIVIDRKECIVGFQPQELKEILKI